MLDQFSLVVKNIAFLAKGGFEQVELIEPRVKMKATGPTLQSISHAGGTLPGMRHDQSGDRSRVHKSIDEASYDDCDSVCQTV